MIRNSVVRNITIYSEDLKFSDEIESTINVLLLLLEDEKIDFDYKKTVSCCADFEVDSNEEH